MYPGTRHFKPRLKCSTISHPMTEYSINWFISDYILENVYLYVFAYVLLYAAFYYANKIVKRTENLNQQLSNAVKQNMMKMNDVIQLKDQCAEYEKALVEEKKVMTAIMTNLETETEKITKGLELTENRINDLEETLAKFVPTSNVMIKSSVKEEEKKGNVDLIPEGVPKVLQSSLRRYDPSRRRGVIDPRLRPITTSASYTPVKSKTKLTD